MAEVAEAERKSSAPAGHNVVPTADLGATRTAPGGVAVTPDDPASRTALGQLAVQAKTQVGAASDPFEHEADRVADKVMQGGTAAVSPSGSAIRRQPVHEPPPQPRPSDASAGPVAEHVAEPVTDRVQSLIDASSGRGDPLPAAARSMFESSLGRDLSGVRVHDDAAAHEATASVGALAFTRGRDIYMSPGRYDPDGPEGQRLLAHELAHVVQQEAAPAGSPLRRAADTVRRVPVNPRPTPGGTYTVVLADKSDPAIEGREDLRVGNTINVGTATMELHTVPIAPSKAAVIPPGQIQVAKNADRERSGNAHEIAWAAAVRPGYEAGVDAFLGRLGARARIGNAYYLRFGPGLGRGQPLSGLRPVVGSRDDIMTALWRPFWTRAGNFERFQIDHIKDYALRGENEASNLRLLDADSNQALGPLVRNPIRRAMAAMVTIARARLSGRVPTFAQVDANWDRVWIRSWGVGPDAPHRQQVWTTAQMTAAALTKFLQPASRTERERLRGSPDMLVLYSSGRGFSAIEIPYHPDAARRVPVAGAGRSNRFEIQSVRMTHVGDEVVPNSKVGEISVFARYKGEWIRDKQVKLDVMGMTGVRYGGVVTSAAATEKFGQVFKYGSPFAFDTLDLDLNRGFSGRATLRPSLEVLRNAEIAIVVENGEIAIETTISAAELTLPGPIVVTRGAIHARIGTSLSPSVGGELAFELRNLAQGFVRLGFDETDGFSFHGDLATLPDKPYTAEGHVQYQRGAWSLQGTVSVGPGRITGITRGHAAVSLAADRLSAEGEFTSSFRGLTGGRLSLVEDPATGTTIAGSLTLGPLPGIEGGEVAASVQQTPAGAWSLSGSVTARPSIPGVTGTITGRYEDGAFLAEADLGYHRGMLDGRVHLGVTNQAVGPGGRPAGPPVPGRLVVWGGGSLRLQLTPWLIGTATVEVRPNGTIAVAGEVALPETFTLFDRRELHRRLFSIGIDIPIVGIAVAGQRVGIFATVSGGLDLVAGIGPGQLLGTGVRVSYDPDREDATTVEGNTRLVVPADAGLRLFIRGGVGAGIPLVSAEAGVELSGQLGLAGQLTAQAHLLWTRSQGLVFDAEAGLTVQPKFTFTADLFALVSIGIGWLSKDIYDEHWRLASFEYGSDLRFGVFLPMHAEAGRFDFSFDRMRFEYPSIDPTEIAGGVIRHIVG